MRDTTTVVIGAGHCGLAMSRCLAERSVDHVVLERGEVANSWRTQRWDSMRLLTPNWMTRLPGYAYRGDDPDGYLAVPEVVRLIEDYATESAAPVVTGTTVTSVRPGRRGYVVQTDQGSWHAPTVVVATGAASVANVPARLAEQVPAGITTVTTADYRNPEPASGRRRAGRRRLGERGPDRRGAAALRAAGDAGRRRARADAADLPGPRHLVVDGRVGSARRALRRGAGPGPGAQPAVDAAGRLAGAGDGRPQLAAPARGAAGRPIRRHPRRDGAVLRVPAATCARWPTSSWAGCWTPSTRGRTGPGSAWRTRRSGSRRPSCRHPSRCRRASAPVRSRRSSGRPATATSCPGSTSPVFDRKGRVRARRRGHGQPRPVPDRPAVPAPPQVHPDRRRRGGRPRADRPPGRLPGHDRPPAAGRPAG